MAFLPYVRSSNYGTFDLCPHKFFIVYNLGIEDVVSKRTEMGSIFHKFMELLARSHIATLNKQEGFESEGIGWISIDDYSIDTLTELAFRYQSKTRPDLDWSLADLKECKKWSEKGIEYNNGELDPRKQDILEIEKYFDFTIDADWANYKYDFLSGETVTGKLACKGTIDLITKVNEDTLHIVDYKTGARRNWATGEEKTFDKLNEDFQLQFYYYAIRRLYPQYKHCIVTIFYLNAGGAFTVAFSESDLPKIENKIRQRFEEVNRMQSPSLNPKACGFCHFALHKGGRYTTKDGVDTKVSACQFFKDEIAAKGVDLVMLEHGDPKKLFQYSEGGGKIHTKEM